MSILDKFKDKYKDIKLDDIKDARYLKRRVFADTIFFNGNIETGDSDNPRAGLLAVKDRFVVAATDVSEMPLLQNKKTVLVDLEGKTLRPGKILWDESFAFSREQEQPFVEQMAQWAKAGITSVFNCIDDVEGEIVTRDILLDAMHAKITPFRYFGSLKLAEANEPSSVKLTLDSQAKICMTLDGIINFDTLVVDVNETMSDDYLKELFSTCGSRGYNIRVLTNGKDSTMKCAASLADLAESYTSFAYSVVSDYRPSAPERNSLDAPNLMFLPDEEIAPARIIGKAKFLGTLKEGSVADLCIFDGETCIKTYLAGQEVYSVSAAENWWTQYTDSQAGKKRKLR